MGKSIHQQLNEAMNAIHDLADGVRQEVEGEFHLTAEKRRAIREDAVKLVAAVDHYESLLK